MDLVLTTILIKQSYINVCIRVCSKQKAAEIVDHDYKPYASRLCRHFYGMHVCMCSVCLHIKLSIFPNVFAHSRCSIDTDFNGSRTLAGEYTHTPLLGR